MWLEVISQPAGRPVVDRSKLFNHKILSFLATTIFICLLWGSTAAYHERPRNEDNSSPQMRCVTLLDFAPWRIWRHVDSNVPCIGHYGLECALLSVCEHHSTCDWTLLLMPSES